MHNKRFIIAIAVAVLVGLLGVCFLFFVVFFTLSVPELPAQTPPSYLLEAFKDIHDSKILFNPPLEMDQGKAARIEARISYSDIGDAITKGLKGPGKPQVEAIQVGQEMTVKLYADKKDFEIKKYSSDEQWVEGRPFAQWEWDVTPLSYGDLPMHLKAAINLKALGSEAQYDVPVVDRIISVRVNAEYIAAKAASDRRNWDLLLGSGIGVVVTSGIVTVIIAWWRRKKGQEGKDWETP